MNIVTVFGRTARRYPDRTFLFDHACEVTYGEADQRSDAIAVELQSRGVADGDTVALASPDCVDLWLTIFGLWKAGALPALVDARTGAGDLPYFLEDIGADLTIADRVLHDPLGRAGASQIVGFEALSTATSAKQLNLHSEASPLFLSYTSGTTGKPKGAVLRSGPVTLGTAVIADRLALSRDDVLLATTPTSSSFQLVSSIMPAIHVGASVGLVAGSTVDEMWAVALASGATVLVAYPLTLADMVNHPKAERETSPFRIAVSGGSPLAPRIKRDYRERLGIPLLESYGQSELGGFMALGRVDDDPERLAAGYVGRCLADRLVYVGNPVTTTEVPAGDVGEALVTEGFFAEYRNKPHAYEQATSGGVLHTGDLVTADHDGYLKVLGRTREGERAGVRQCFLREVEDAYYEHPSVLHAAVVEGSDHAIEAFVELRDGYDASPEELHAHMSSVIGERLKVRRTTILHRVPRSFSGKADRLALSKSCGE